MIEKIYQKENLIQAFKKVKKNKGAFGIDRVSIRKYEDKLERNIKELERLLRLGKYNPLPVKRVFIPKLDGKKRPLGIPAVRDRVVQQAILEVIQPIFEPLFANSSYGFRPNCSPIQAVNKVQEYLDQGYEYIVEADIKDFFGTLNHQRLISKVKEEVKDKKLLKLIWKFLKSGVMEEGKLKKVVSGTPQGGVISPILANIYLNDFDYKIEKAGLKLVRYADDFVILTKSVNQATFAMKMIKELIKSIKLKLAREKTKITEYWWGFEFLGYCFRKYYGNYKWPAEKSIKAFKEKIRHKTRRQQPKNVIQVITEINPLVRGWGHYFKYGNVKTRFPTLDSWIRMRLRSFIEKKKWPSGLNWKYPNDHFRSLGLFSLTKLLKYQQKLSFSI